MNFVKKITPKRALSVLDVGAETAVVLITQKKNDGSFEVLGAGNVPARGFKDGAIEHLGDAVETVVEALRKAERAAGLQAGILYFNFDDPDARSFEVRGSKQLSGEGEIRRTDVEQACQTAKRLVSHFERTTVYFKETGFVIDERDFVLNPLGVFGSKLDVIAHVVQASSRMCEEWSRLMERAQVEKSVSVFSAWSTACGVLPKEDRAKKRFIVDAGRDLTSVFLFEHNGIAHYRVFLTVDQGADELGLKLNEKIREFSKKSEGVDQVFLTGDYAGLDALERFIKSDLGMQVHKCGSLGVEKLTHPRYAALVGLLHAADDLEKKNPTLRKKSSMISQARDRVVTYINEYF